MTENPYYILSPEEAMEELQIGRNAIYKLLSTGKLAVESINFSFRKVTKKEQAHCIHRLILFQFLSVF